MDFIIILQAGVASGTVLLFATIGEILLNVRVCSTSVWKA